MKINLVKIVKPSYPSQLPYRLALAAAFLLALVACNRRGHRVLEVNYVSAVQATLRDQVATMYSRVGTVKNGERVEVLERELVDVLLLVAVLDDVAVLVAVLLLVDVLDDVAGSSTTR